MDNLNDRLKDTYNGSVTVKDIYDSMNGDQKMVLCFIVGKAVHDAEVKKNYEIGALKRKIKSLEKELSIIKSKED